MSALVRLCLLLTALTALVSAKVLSEPTVYNNCSGKSVDYLPGNVDSTEFFKPQIRINPAEIMENGTGWEEWLFIAHNRLQDGSELMYGYKWALGDPTSSNVSHNTFIAWAYFPNGTFYRQIEHDTFKYEKHADGGFTYTILDNHLTWDPVNDLWNVSINAGGYVIQSSSQNVIPGVPFAPNHGGKLGQLSDGFYSRMDAPRAHTDGEMTFPWGAKYPIQSIGTIKHTWGNAIMGDAISSFVRGSIFLPNIPPLPIATLNFFQSWDNSGNEVNSMQLLQQPDGHSDGQVFRLQVSDAPDVFSVVTTPKPVALPLSYESTEITLPMCGPGASSKDKMVWKIHNMYNLFNFIDFANGSTLYQRVNLTGTAWVNGTATPIAGGVGLIEVYHRL